jgi:hypothetical protein
MMSERRINLDTATPRFGPQTDTSAGANPGLANNGLERGTGQPKQAPQPQDQARFESLLKGSDGSNQAAAPLVTPSPFALFGAGSMPGAAVNAQPQAAAPTDTARHLLVEVSNMAQRLMVSGDAGNSRQVRMELDEAAFPGVSVVIDEDQGRWRVCFVCRQESPRLRLVGEIDAMAQTLAERLAREVCVQVRTDDDEDPCWVERVTAP